jgi:hypothetical protein
VISEGSKPIARTVMCSDSRRAATPGGAAAAVAAVAAGGRATTAVASKVFAANAPAQRVTNEAMASSSLSPAGEYSVVLLGMRRTLL